MFQNDDSTFFCIKTENQPLAAELLQNRDRNLSILHAKHEDPGIRMVCKFVLGKDNPDAVQ